MKPFKFLSNPYLDYQADMVIYEQGWEAADVDIDRESHDHWVYCPHQVGTREYDIWGQGYRDRHQIIDYRRPRS